MDYRNKWRTVYVLQMMKKNITNKHITTSIDKTYFRLHIIFIS